MGEYVLEDFGKCKGYKITEQELFKITDIVYPERDYGDGWHEEVHGNIWEKDDKKRNYLKLKKCRNYKLRSEKTLGYYDYVSGVYVVRDYRMVAYDAIEKYNEMN